MALPIRKGATHKVVLGPFADVGDGFTPQTDITLGGDEAEGILHNNATVVDISAYTWAAIANCRGYYHLTLQTGITNTEGHLTIVVQDDSDCLPVKAEFIVMSTVSYDALYAATSTLITTLDIGLLFESTVGTANSQVSFDMDDSIITDDNWIGNTTTIEDVSTGDSWVTWVADVDQTNDRLILAAAPPFTAVATDVIRVKDVQHPTYALNTYDPATRAEATADKDSILAKLLAYFRLMARSDGGPDTDDSTELTAINADAGAGAGDYDPEVDSAEAISDGAGWNFQVEDQGGGYTAKEVMSILLAEAAGTAVYTAATRTWQVKDPSGGETRFTIVYGGELDGDRVTSTPAPVT